MGRLKIFTTNSVGIILVIVSIILIALVAADLIVDSTKECTATIQQPVPVAAAAAAVSARSVVAPPCADIKYRSLNGTCTGNLLNPRIGSVSGATLENVESGRAVSLQTGPNERVLSNLFFKGAPEIENTLGVNLWFTFFSEISDIHTHLPVTATHSGATQSQLFASGNPLSILDYQCLSLTSTFPGGAVDPTDLFSPLTNPNISIPYLFSCDSVHSSGDECAQSRCFCTKNEHTPWIDLDNTVYPHDEQTLAASRTLVDGKLKMYTLNSGEQIPPTWAQTGRQFPFNGLALFAPLPNPNTSIDIAGGLGAASLNVLTTISLFYREHNRLCDWLKQQNPTWTDEQLFQRARAWNIAQVQSIWAYEWLQTALGSLYEPLFGSTYKGHNAVSADGTIPTAFDSAIRSIHSTLYEELEVVLQGPTTVAELPAIVALANSSGHIDLLNSPLFGGSTSPIVRSWIVQPCNALDSIYAEFIRSLLPPGSPVPALDLAAADIHRSRLDKQVNYYDSRKFWRLDDLYAKPGCTPGEPQDPIACFLAISSDLTTAYKLQQVYGKVDRIDLHVGAMLEDRVGNTILAPTHAYIMAKTFQTIRSSDLFWFENTNPKVRQFTNTEIATIKATKLIDLINRNTPLTCPLPAGTPNSFSVVANYAC